MMEISSESDADPSYYPPLNGDLTNNLCKGTNWLYQPVSIYFLNYDLDFEGKMRGQRLSLP
jgi:hypothetical protein